MYEITIKDLDSDLEMHAQTRFIAAMWDTAEEHKADGGEGGIKEAVLGMASPYRTFQEVDQPSSQFLIRITERGIKFVEADGGMWKLAARQTIKKHLEEALKDEVDRGTVVIAL